MQDERNLLILKKEVTIESRPTGQLEDCWEENEKRNVVKFPHVACKPALL
jgi:hypothetical protein